MHKLKIEFIFLFFILFTISCANSPDAVLAKEDTVVVKKIKDPEEDDYENYINAIKGYTDINLDSVPIGKGKIGKIDLDFTEDDRRVFKLWFKGYRDTLKFDAEQLELYQEEDITGDGVNEIGILPGYSTSACRTYHLFDISSGKWNELITAQSHLPDRIKGVNYFAIKNGKFSITESSYDCCCQCDCLTTKEYKRLKK